MITNNKIYNLKNIKAIFVISAIAISVINERVSTGNRHRYQ